MDYKKTLNITLSDRDPGAMPQRANLPEREVALQKHWDAIGLYRLSLEKEAPRGTFILHDGPPYSNANIHLGHALNKIAKDIIVKYRTMQGYRAPYVPGWDNHGMPIENNVSKEFMASGIRPDKVTMRKRCREYAAVWVEKQKEQFKRLGVRGDWDNPYLTMSTEFEAKIVEVFGRLAEKGYIYRDLKPVLWCARCETALADAEVEYEPHTSNSIYVRFPLLNDPTGLFGETGNAAILIWTTTPWTIPANLALAVHPDAEYSLVETEGEVWLLAQALVGRVMEALGRAGYVVRKSVRGSALEGIVAQHPLFARTSPVVLANYVTMEDGTGVVHTAPGHGKEDFETGSRYGLEVLCPVDASGAFTAQAGASFEGARILTGEADQRVLEALREAGHLLAHSRYDHSYPHCWRCHSPLLFRATVQWFMNIDHEGHRQRSLEAINRVQWFPAVSINRISAMVANRPDWCLSRQRAWGVGIPAFYCRSCGREVISQPAIEAVRDLVSREGSDAWYAIPAEEILPADFACPHCGGTKFDKETDILDVWFDSGSTHVAVLESPQWPELRRPADLYLEGSDQHRGWFNSSLMISVGLDNTPPYRAVITNGFTVDEQGRKMSKSLGNVIEPLQVMEKSGADILRLWVASTDYFEDVNSSAELLDQIGETYRRIRNTFRFLVNNLYVTDYRAGEPVRRPFDPTRDAVPEEQMLDLDRWALAQLDRVVAACAAGYEVYEFHRVYHTISSFCVVELSAFYMDVLKDRLYCEASDSLERRSALTALHTLAHTLARLLAPILSHTAEEVWGYLQMPDKPVSVQLADFPTADPSRHAEVLARWEPVLAIRQSVNQAVEAAKQEKRINNPLEAQVELATDARTATALEPFTPYLPVIFKVSQVALSNGRTAEEGTAIRVETARGEKCARCWLIKTDVGTDAAYSDLCGRCAEVIKRLPQNGD